GMTGQFRSLFSFQGTMVFSFRRKPARKTHLFVSFFHRQPLSGDFYNISQASKSLQVVLLTNHPLHRRVRDNEHLPAPG
ncbi:hypothetical protein, partial [uncultured Paenibacillus sp.]|uniref:hypothetical protein n=1 Tax=uncultured Paenibacillus sp. TaxID=227322 RepID=UPI0028D8465C